MDLCCCTDFSLVIVSGGSSLVVVCYLLSLWSMGSIAVAHRPSCSSDRWNLPGPGIKLMSPALAGRVLTTEPPGKPWWFFLKAVLEETLLCGYFQCSDSWVTASALPFLSTVVGRHLLCKQAYVGGKVECGPQQILVQGEKGAWDIPFKERKQ